MHRSLALRPLLSTPYLATILAACVTTDDSGPAGQRSADLPLMGAVEGRFESRRWTMLDGTAKLTHHLVSDTQEVEIILPERVHIDLAAKVRVWGQPAPSGGLLVDDFEVVEPPPQPLIDDVPLTPRRIATILVFWDQPGLSNGNARQSMFTGAKATNVFYEENSYGRERLLGEVFGPYQIDDPGGCDPGAIGASARQAMAEHGHNPNDFQQLMYHFPNLNCGFGGLGSVGTPEFPARDSWYNGSFGCTVRVQELGHNYGMSHSHSYENCGVDENGDPIAFGDTCEAIEYGDPYDPMGDGCGHMNAVQKIYMNWLDDCNVVNGRSDGTYNLMALELPCDGTQALLVPTYDNRYYYLEYRRTIGAFDVSVGGSGVVVHVADAPSNRPPEPHILFLGQNGLMHEGDSYSDPGGRVTFTIEQELDTHAVIRVTYPDGGSGEATCLDGSSPETEGTNVGSLECLDQPHPADDTPPSVAITHPVDGDVLAPGASFNITAQADDDRGVTDLQLYVNGEPFSTLDGPPWQWPVTSIPAGNYQFGVVARDGRNTAPSEAVDIVVGTPSAETSSSDSDEQGSGGQGVTTSDNGPTDDTTSGPEPAHTGGGMPNPSDSGGSGNAAAAADDTSSSDGCGCAQSPAGAMPALFALGGLLRRRRR